MSTASAPAAGGNPNAFKPKLPAVDQAAEAHKQAVFDFADAIWKRAEDAAKLDDREIIVTRDISLAVRQTSAIKEAGYLSGLSGSLLLGAAVGAPLGWLPDLSKVNDWHWATAAVAGLIGILFLLLSRRSRRIR